MTLLIHYCPVPPGLIACDATRGLSDNEAAYVTCPDCLNILAEGIGAR